MMGPARIDRWLARARRVAVDAPAGNAIEDLFDGIAPEDVRARRGLGAAELRGVASFYDLLTPGHRVCDGTTCRFASHVDLAAQHGGKHVACLGACHDAPAALIGGVIYGHISRRDGFDAQPGLALRAETRPVPRRTLVDPPVVLRNLLDGAHSNGMSEYDLPDGDTILAAIEKADLRGRGGAAYPTAAKWRSARDTPAAERIVVANGDEGDPGSFVDRLLLEEDPHAVLAGMVACARVIGARRGIVYIRGEYARARAVMLDAVHAARAAGHLGDGFDVEVISGAGSYVCGEETALLRSIEGLRGEPTPKPPYPAQSGLGGLPTVVQNVETLAIVPWIARNGRGGGTKAICLSGCIARPGLVEVALGTPLRRVLTLGGNGEPPGRRWKMALIGGPMGTVVPESGFDVPLSYQALSGLGHGGVVLLDDTVSARDLAGHLYHFAQSESCGNCAPCRIGTRQLASRPDRASLERLLVTLERGSLCGFGQGVPRPIRDLLQHFPGEMFPC